MLAYLRFDRTGNKASYGAALGLFVLALLSKTVTATLPAALLVIFWWQRGRLRWKRDVLPLVPFLALALAGGLLSAWMEKKVVGAEGAEFNYTIIERFLIAGRAVWFYASTLVWPADLVFIYPRWHVSQAVRWQYLFPLTAAAVLAMAWWLRGRTRAPLAALLFFGGTLFPALGFVNVYPFRFSFVADHFQYLASLGLIVSVSAGVSLLFRTAGKAYPRTGLILQFSLLLFIAMLSWSQSRTYADPAILYQATIARNPACWMAYNNLGTVLDDRGRIDEAIASYQAALDLKPDYAEAHCNLGNILAGRGAVEQAIAHYQKALEMNADYDLAHNNLGTALMQRGRIDEAIDHFRRAVEIKPAYAKAHYNLANALATEGQVDGAITHYREALDAKPDYVEAHHNLGNFLAGRGQFREALVHYQKAVDLRPDNAVAHDNLGHMFACCGQFDEAIGQYRRAVEIAPDFPDAKRSLVAAVSERERILKTLDERRAALRSLPRDTALLTDTAWTLATSPYASLRNGLQAVELAQQARNLCGGQEPTVLGTLAAAYAEAGRFPDAVTTAEQAFRLATATGNRALAEKMRVSLDLFRTGKPYRDVVSRQDRPRH